MSRVVETKVGITYDDSFKVELLRNPWDAEFLATWSAKQEYKNVHKRLKIGSVASLRNIFE